MNILKILKDMVIYKNKMYKWFNVEKVGFFLLNILIIGEFLEVMLVIVIVKDFW